jgi:2'-hydroxyisoflavone reductase
MKTLVLGGTAWLGHLIASTAVAAGHDVTCLARGTAVPDGATLVRADRDHDDALASVVGHRWDAVIDVAREPGQVRRAVRDLEPLADRYLFVSTTSVYAAPGPVGADESADRVAPLVADRMTGPDDYGSAKAAAEDAVLAAFGPDRALIARAGLIGGPGDPTGRTDYWPWRFAHPTRASSSDTDTGTDRGTDADTGTDTDTDTGTDTDTDTGTGTGTGTDGHFVLVPDSPDLPTSVIDVRDLAEWLVRCAEQGTSGVMDAVGPSVLFPAHLEAAREAAGTAGASPTTATASAGWLLARDVGQWAGPRSLPLWIADADWYGMNARAGDRARSAGLTHRLLVETLRDALDDRRRRSDPGTRPSGLGDDDHAALLAELLAGADARDGAPR